MNLAFTALLVLILAAPGFIIVAFLRLDRGRPTGYRPIADELPFALFASVVVHTALVPLANTSGWLLGNFWGYTYEVDLRSAFALLVNNYGKNDELYDRVLESVTFGYHPLLVVLYFLSAVGTSIILAKGLIHLADNFGLARVLPILESNHWTQILRTDSELLLVADPAEEQPDGVLISAVSNGYLYVGVLVDFAYSQAYVVESLTLMAPSRRPFGAEADITPDEAYYDIATDYLVLKYSECENLAVKGIYFFAPKPAGPNQLTFDFAAGH